MPGYWVSTPRHTVQVEVNAAGIVTRAAPAVQRTWLHQRWQTLLAFLQHRYGARLRVERLPEPEEIPMRKVYIAGPYSHGDVARNVRNAITFAHELARRGYAPYVPHLNHFWHLVYPRPYAEWMALDTVWVAQCDALLRIPGLSPGADQEVPLAARLGIPIFTALQDLVEAMPSEGHLVGEPQRVAGEEG